MAAISLKQLLEDEHTLYAHCLNVRGQLHDPPFSKPPCSHGRTVDIAKLIEAVGDEVDLYSPEIQRRFKCDRCDARGASFISTPPHWSTSTAGRESRGAKH